MIDFIMISFNAPRKGWSGFKIQKETDLKFGTMERNVAKTILAHFEEYFVDFLDLWKVLFSTIFPKESL